MGTPRARGPRDAGAPTSCGVFIRHGRLTAATVCHCSKYSDWSLSNVRAVLCFYRGRVSGSGQPSAIMWPLPRRCLGLIICRYYRNQFSTSTYIGQSPIFCHESWPKDICRFNPLMHDFYFRGKTWIVRLLRTSGDWNETFFIWILNGVFSHQVSYSVLLKGRYALMG